MKAATSKGATSTRAVGQSHTQNGQTKNKGKQRRGRAQSEATTTTGRTLKVASLNVQGFNKITKRQSIEKWALERKIDVAMAQETRINETSREEKPKHMWYFSTSTKFKDKEQVEKREQPEVRQPEQSGNRPLNTMESEHWWQKNWSQTEKKSSRLTGG